MRHALSDGRFLGWLLVCGHCDWWTTDTVTMGLLNDGAPYCPECNTEFEPTDFKPPWGTEAIANQMYYCDHEYDSYCGKCGLAS